MVLGLRISFARLSIGFIVFGLFGIVLLSVLIDPLVDISLSVLRSDGFQGYKDDRLVFVERPKSVYGGKSQIQIVAHRGGGTQEGRIENTLGSFNVGNRSTGFFELDVDLSSDGIPVLFHDSTLNRLIHPKYADLASKSVFELETSQLIQLELVETGQHIATLNDLLRVYENGEDDANSPVYMVDLKRCEGDDTKVDAPKKSAKCTDLIHHVMLTLEEFHVEMSRLVFSSTQPEALRVVQTRKPGVASTISMDLKYLWYSESRLVDAIENAQVSGISAYYQLVQRRPRAFRNMMKNRNAIIFVWTVNSPQVTSNLISLGFTNIITDVPSQISQHVRSLTRSQK
mmetsp:Transcript_7890/g.14310  ORF Transcript_7890/g.14310 Transcript_7890/m.14310 type:complete len:343 (-) Transcript_7890:40-1068(-)